MRPIFSRSLVAVAAGAALAGGLLLPTAASAASPGKFPNCASMHRYYPHGIGLPGAHDHVRGHTRPVNDFYVNRRLYDLNRGLDRDHDGIACEKR